MLLGAKPLLLVPHALDTERALRGLREWESVPPSRAFLVEWHVAIALDQGNGVPRQRKAATVSCKGIRGEAELNLRLGSRSQVDETVSPKPVRP
jgi:hypothetical protein